MFLLQQGGSPFGGMSGIIFMGLIMVVFWLFFIRPQAKKQKTKNYLLRIFNVAIKW